MSTIGGIGSGYGMAMHDMGQARGLRRPDPEAMASQAFSKIDTSGRGYIEKADLQSAMDATSSSTGRASSVNVDDLFTKLDGDGDGKVTKDEFSTGSKAIADEMRQQYGSMGRLGGGMGGMGGMPPMQPPPGDGAGFTKDELTSQLDSIGSSDDRRSGLLSSIVDNFDVADGDGDGKVSFDEARTFAESSRTDSGTSTSSAGSSSSTNASSTSSDLTASLTQQITRLLHAYGSAAASEAVSTLTLTA